MKPEPKPRSKLEQFRALLAIDRDALDSCLVEQAELFFHVADAHARAVAVRDGAKLDIEQAEAAADVRLRAQAAAREEKLTEPAIMHKLRLDPKLVEMRNKLLECQQAVGQWAALKEAYLQRNYMLKEIVAMHLSRLSGSSISETRARWAEGGGGRPYREGDRR